VFFGIDAVQLLGRVERLLDRRGVPGELLRPGERRDSIARDLERVRVVVGEVVGHARGLRVDEPPPSSSGVTSSPVAAFTSGGPHEGRSCPGS